MGGISQMKEHYDDQNQIRSYLLGRLSEAERELIEDKIFAEPAFFDRVRMTEEELLEDYVFKVLPPADAKEVANRLMRTPEQIQRWQINAALKTFSDAQKRAAQPTVAIPTPPVPADRVTYSPWRWAIAASVLVVVGIGIWFFRATSLEQRVASLNVPGAITNTQADFGVELPALRFRSDVQAATPEQRVAVPKGVAVVQIRLPVEVSAYSKYHAALIREPDSTLFTLNDRVVIASGNQKLLVVRVPADALVPGEYRLLVKGVTDDARVDDLGTYSFTIL
jgi:hypothetical protein